MLIFQQYSCVAFTGVGKRPFFNTRHRGQIHRGAHHDDGQLGQHQLHADDTLDSRGRYNYRQHYIILRF
jgi:hypothetical protein